MKHPPMVEITWIDSAFNRGWGEKDDKRKSMGTSECRTVGYLLSKDTREVKIAMSTSDTSYGDGMSIPTSCVTRIQRLHLTTRGRR